MKFLSHFNWNFKKFKLILINLNILIVILLLLKQPYLGLFFFLHTMSYYMENDDSWDQNWSDDTDFYPTYSDEEELIDDNIEELLQEEVEDYTYSEIVEFTNKTLIPVSFLIVDLNFIEKKELNCLIKC